MTAHSLPLFLQAIRSLRSEADWQEILKKVKEEEEESSVPTDLFKVVSCCFDTMEMLYS